MAVSLLGSWISQSGITASHAIESGSDRLFVIIIGMSSTSFPNVVTSVTMGGQSLTKLIDLERIQTITSSASVWYAKGSTIAAMSDGNISMTFTVDPAQNTILTDHAFFGGVDQTTPWEDSDSASDISVTTLSLPAINTVNGGLFVAGVASSSGAGLTTWTNATELSDNLNSGTPSVRLSSASAATTGSTVAASVTKDASASRIVMVGGSMRPAAGGGSAFANPLSLLGVGRAA